MNQTPKGRIRWAVTALAIACCAALPATSAASTARSQVIVQLDAGASADAVKAQVREYGGRAPFAPALASFSPPRSQKSSTTRVTSSR